MFKKIFNWVDGMFKDERGIPSSKRFVGVFCALSLAITLYHTSFSTNSTAPAEYLVNAVAMLAFGCLGLASVDKFTALKKSIEDTTKENS